MTKALLIEDKEIETLINSLEAEYDLEITKLHSKEEEESIQDPFNLHALRACVARLEVQEHLTPCEQLLLDQTKSMIKYVYYLRNRGE